MYSLVEIGILNALTAGAVALVVLLISRLVRRPAIIHALWVLVLLKLVTPPIIEIPVGLRLERLASLTETGRAASDATPTKHVAPKSTATRQPTSPLMIAAPSSGPLNSHQAIDVAAFRPQDRTTTAPATTATMTSVAQWSSWAAGALSSATLRRGLATTVPILLGVWIAGTMVWFAVGSWRILRFARFAATGQLAAADIQTQAQQIAVKIGARRAPQVWVLNATMSPFLWALGGRARIMFPADLLERVDEAGRATLLTHELAHYHRGDHWVRLLEFAVTGLFWWHPVIWIARREIEISEEHCCDAWVVAQFPAQPRRYAEALLDTIDFLSEDRPRVAPVASGLGQAPFLRERIRRIMSGVAPKSMSGTTRLAVLAVSAVLLPLGPQLFEGAIRRADAALTSTRGHDKDRGLGALDGSHPASSARHHSTRHSLSAPFRPDLDAPASDHDNDPSLDALTGLGQPGQREARSTVIGIADEFENAMSLEVATWVVVNSPDGRFQAEAKSNGGVVLKDTIEQRSFDLLEYQISSIAFTPHRDLMAAGSSDSTVYLFDCASGESVARFTGHDAAIGSVAVSLDGRFVVSGSRDGVVKLWDIDHECEVPSRIPAQSSAINCVRFSPDGRLLAVASGDWRTSDEGSVVVWDLRGGTTRQRFNAPAPVGAVAFGTDQLVVAQWNGQTTTWNLQTGAATASGTLDKDTVSAASFATDSQFMLLAAANGDAVSATTTEWFQRMDRDRDGNLAWNEFKGPRGTFRKLDVDADDIVTLAEIGATP